MKKLREEYEQDKDSFSRNHPLVASLFSNAELDSKDILLLLVEILQGGIDAVRK